MLSISLQILINGLTSGLLYALVALGFSLIYSGTRIFDIGYGATYTASPYLFLALLPLTGVILGGDNALTFVISIAITLLLASAFGFIFEIAVYRPLFKKNAPTLVAFISSLGIYIVMVNLIALLFGNDTKILNPGLEPSFSLAGAIITRIQIIEIIVPVVLIILMLFILKKTALGRNIRALSDNPTLLSVLGTDIKKVRMLLFVIASFLAASSSLIRAFDVGVDPYVGMSAVLTATVAVIVGGVGSNYGAVFTAVFLGLAQNLVVWFTSAQWQHAVTFVILVVVLIFRREGLFAPRMRLEER